MTALGQKQSFIILTAERLDSAKSGRSENPATWLVFSLTAIESRPLRHHRALTATIAAAAIAAASVRAATGQEGNNYNGNPYEGEKTQGCVTWVFPIKGNKKSQRRNPSPENGLEQASAKSFPSRC